MLAAPLRFSSCNLYFQDESRFGLLTSNGKALTAKGIKPVCPFQQTFENLYLFGAFSPVSGDHFLLEMPHCNADNFGVFLQQFAKQKPEEFKIMVLDNGAFHKARSLVIPENIALLFLPPYSPELNPAEKMWALFKRRFTNLLCKTLEDVSTFISSVQQTLTEKGIIQTCAFDYIFADLNWTT